MKIALVGSSGGHLAHLLALEAWWRRHDRLWVTFDKPDATSALDGENVVFCHGPTNRNVPNLLRNTALAWSVLSRERPDLVISTGAAVAVPFFALARVFGARTVYVEVIDRMRSPTLTGRIVYPIADRFYVQWEEQRHFYPKARCVGELL